MILPTAQIIQWLLIYKYFLLFPIAIIEGPIITVIAGFLSSTGHLNFLIAFVVVAVADTVGDGLYYAVGRWGGTRLVKRWGSKVGLTLESVQKIEHHYVDHAGKTLMAGKFSHVFGAPTLVAAGMARMSIGRFFLFTTIGTIPKSLIFLLVGYFFGSSYASINNYINYGSLYLFLGGISLIIIYCLIFRISKKYL